MRRPRVLWTVLGVLAVLSTIAIQFVRAQPITNVLELVVAVGAPYISVAVALSGVALALLSRRLILSIVAVWVAVAAFAVQVPWYYVGDSPVSGSTSSLRVLSSNLRLGQADPTTFVAIASRNADVVTVSELTPKAVENFEHAGIASEFPHTVLNPRPGAGGIGLYSRFPITAVSPGKPQDYSMAAARVDVPGVRFDPLVASVHITSPVASKRNTVDQWRIGIGAVKTAMSAFAVATDPGAVIVAGDFNSTPDERQFRDLMANGYRDAVEQTGGGFAPTFPSRTWHPPLLTIDHIITRNAAAASIKTVFIPGSDHRALLATINVPLDPTS
jgi:endonuclease/exonuclease/phosphatase (EEP) superfamily protein YafD